MGWSVVLICGLAEALTTVSPLNPLAVLEGDQAFKKLAQRCVGTGALEERRAVVADPRYLRQLEEVSDVDTLRYAAALTTQEPSEATELTAAALKRITSRTPAEVTGLRWIAERCRPFVDTEILTTLREREQELKLPFEILPGLALEALNETVDELAKTLPFVAEDVVTRSGVTVKERRHTAWVAKSDIGYHAYSGKMMKPISPLPDPVERMADHLKLKLPSSPRYDCALLNLYPDGGAACRYHSDPEHGTYWNNDEAIVSVGEPRRFGFRLVRDPVRDDHRHTFYLFHGDVVHMHSDCQDRFQHAVFKAEDDVSNKGPRISFVMKNALLRANGKKGHGISTVTTTTTTSRSTKKNQGRRRQRQRRRRT